MSFSHLMYFVPPKLFALYLQNLYNYFTFYCWHSTSCRKKTSVLNWKWIPQFVTGWSLTGNHEYRNCNACREWQEAGRELNPKPNKYVSVVLTNLFSGEYFAFRCAAAYSGGWGGGRESASAYIHITSLYMNLQIFCLYVYFPQCHVKNSELNALEKNHLINLLFPSST